MKFYNIFLGSAIAVASLAFTACNDFLDEKPRTAITEEQMYSDPTYVESVVSAQYTKWRNFFTDRFIWQPMIGTDEIQQGALQALKEDNMKAGAPDRFDALLTAEHSYVKDQWKDRWKIVGETAKIIRAMASQTESSAKAKTNYGEASFMRGGICMELTLMYGRIPVLDLDRVVSTGYGRRDLKEVWAFIINDLKEAARCCPQSNEPGRATSYAAYMLLGYAYMAAPEETGLRDFSLAKEALDKVLAGPFDLVDYRNLWDYNTPNTREAIFEWQFNNNPDQNKVQFQIGSRAVQSMGGDGCFMSGYDHAVPSAWAYSDIDDGGIWENGDVRKNESIRYDFSYYGEYPTLQSVAWEDLGDDHDELLPHIKKYEDFRTDKHSGLDLNNMWYSGKDIPFLRLGNAILLHAECLNELGQSQQAVEEVNRVRARAWDFNLPADKAWKPMSKDQFRDQIMTERIRELFGERWRRFDLVRTGKFLEYVKARNKWANRFGTIQPFNVIWPIPQSEIDQNDDISLADQNEGYH